MISKVRISRKMEAVACAGRHVARKRCRYRGCNFKKYLGTVVSCCDTGLWSMLYHCSLQWRTHEFFFRGGGDSTNSVEDRENGDLGAVAPLVRGSGGSCNLVQEISFHIVTFS